MSEPDRVVSALRYGIAFLIICILSVVVYALLVGGLMPTAPRTRIESALLDARAAVQRNPASGQAWAALAGAQYAGGDTKSAWASIAEADKRVKDHSILLVNLKELDFLLIEGKDEQVIKRADEFIKTEAKFQTDQIKANLASVRDRIATALTQAANFAAWQARNFAAPQPCLLNAYQEMPAPDQYITLAFLVPT